MVAGDFRLRYLHRDRIEQLTPEAVQSFARRYFVAANRTVGLFLPAVQPVRSPPPEIPDAQAVAAALNGYKGRPPPAPGEAFVATIDNIEYCPYTYAISTRAASSYRAANSLQVCSLIV